MRREIHGWHSPCLEKHMDIAVYGHYGFALLMLPTAAADYLEYERFHLISSLRPQVEAGKVKVFSINSINSDSWLDTHAHPLHKTYMHRQFNYYVYDEVLPFVRNMTSHETPVFTCGASLGALHAANLFFRRPDLIDGFIGLSGDYDLSTYSGGYHDDDVYFNSPVQYLPNLNDDYFLPLIRRSNHIHIVTGSGAWENPDASRRLSGILTHKGIPHELDIWGPDMPHDWPTWRDMLPYYLDTRFTEV